MSKRILIIDDEETTLSYLSRYFQAQGYDVAVAEDGAGGLEKVSSFNPDLVLLDLRLPDADGMDILIEIKKRFPLVGVIIITGHGDVDAAIRAMRANADHFVLKPVDLKVLADFARKVIDDYNRQEEVRFLRSRLDAVSGSPGIDQILLPPEVAEKVQILAKTDDTSVLILGETGAGKGVVARLIHDLATHRTGQFIDLNCAGLQGPLLESELFGHESGAFTDAKSRKRGLFELADGGSLFLDEIGDMPLDVQAKLLKVIESTTFRRVGGTQSLKVDVRVMAATNLNLEVAVKKGQFRQDLYYRLSVVPLTLPPLRQWKDSIIPLAKQFVEELSRRLGKPGAKLSRKTESILVAYPWPGNIRELRNVIERALLLSKENEILPRDLPDSLRKTRSRQTISLEADNTLAAMEKAHIRSVLEAVGGNRSHASEVLGIHRATLINKINKYGLSS